MTHSDKSYTCPQGHQFDMAKEGYVNLLPVQHKRSRDPGDSAEMMQARRAFLDAGHYLPLRETVAQMLNDILPGSATAMLDIGCGEGYYTARFAQIAREQGAVHRRDAHVGGKTVVGPADVSLEAEHPVQLGVFLLHRRLPFPVRDRFISRHAGHQVGV